MMLSKYSDVPNILKFREVASCTDLDSDCCVTPNIKFLVYFTGYQPSALFVPVSPIE